MRHEWRGQTKESRELAEQIQSAVKTLKDLEAQRLSQNRGEQAGDAKGSRPLARLIADTDHQLTRAVLAVGQSERQRQLRDDADHEAAQRYFEGMSALARWFARPLLAFIAGQRNANTSPGENPAVEGLSLVLARLRQAMQEQGIERKDVFGQPFDGTTMNAIGTVESLAVPAGHVAEQLAPCYLWNGQLLRFADVRVASPQAKETNAP
jgi:molecular chaperone GrpE